MIVHVDPYWPMFIDTRCARAFARLLEVHWLRIVPMPWWLRGE